MNMAHFKKVTKCHASAKIIPQALRKHNMYYKKLREKRARLAFARVRRGKSAAWVRAFIEGKHFPSLYERCRAARQPTYGACRQPGKGLSIGYVKPQAGNLRHDTGAKGVLLRNSTVQR